METTSTTEEKGSRILLHPITLDIIRALSHSKYDSYVENVTTRIDDGMSFSVFCNLKPGISVFTGNAIHRYIGNTISAYIDEYTKAQNSKNRQLLCVHYTFTSDDVTRHANQVFAFGGHFENKKLIYHVNNGMHNFTSEFSKKYAPIVDACLQYSAMFINLDLKQGYPIYNHKGLYLVVGDWLEPYIESGEFLKNAILSLHHIDIFSVETLPVILVGKSVYIPTPEDPVVYSKIEYPVEREPGCSLKRIGLAMGNIINRYLELPSDYITVKCNSKDLHLSLDEKCEVIDRDYLFKVVMALCYFEDIEHAASVEFDGEHGIHLHISNAEKDVNVWQRIE